MRLNICAKKGRARIVSLIETIDLLSVKEIANLGAAAGRLV